MPNVGAMPTSALLTVYAASVPSRRPLRGSRRVPRVSGMASVATMNAYTVTSSPATDSVTARSSLICGSSPTGTSSVVMATKVASVRATRPPAASRTEPGRHVLCSVRVTTACSHEPPTPSERPLPLGVDARLPEPERHVDGQHVRVLLRVPRVDPCGVRSDVTQRVEDGDLRQHAEP